VRAKVSENVVLFWKGGRLVCDNFAAHRQLALSPAAEPLLRQFSDWRDIGSLGSTELDKENTVALQPLVEQLLKAGILIEEGSEEHLLEEKLGVWDELRRSTRYFHCSVRTLKDTDFIPSEDDGRRLEDKSRREPAPPIYKEYAGAERVALPEPIGSDRGAPLEVDFREVLLRRRTCRDFDRDKPVSLEKLSSLLYYVAGATHIGHAAGTGDVLLKTSPSAGARHSIEVYPCVLNVEGIHPGFYHYSVKGHELELLVDEDPHGRLPKLCGDQYWTEQAGVIFFYVSLVERPRWKYPSPRVYRDICIDLGHLSQTFYLVSAWLGLGAFFTGALRDEALEGELGLNWTEEVVLGANGAGLPLSMARAEGPVRAHP
jgi:SagB-type dehydrogenase family enzyme